MPRVDSGNEGDGLPIPGLYQQMLERERERQSRCDPRWAVERPGEEAPPVYGRPESLLRALEADVPVLVQRSSARSAYWHLTGDRHDPFPWDRSVKTVEVSPADVAKPSDREIPWYGCSVDEFVEGLRR